MRRFGSGQTLAYRISPAQRPFGAVQLTSGVTRPHRETNLWMSDPCQPLPQWAKLSWDTPQNIREVQVVFPGHLIREYHAYGPFYRDPQCAKDYAIQVWRDGAWETVVEVSGNYQRLRRHRLEKAVSTEKLRVVISSTNGDPAAAIYEIRCYQD